MIVEYGPERSETHMMLGEVLKISTLSPALAIKELNKSIALNPNNAEGYVYLAFAQLEMGNFKEAEKNLAKENIKRKRKQLEATTRFRQKQEK